ncbi:MAG: RNA methyltransferase [Alphaproteobacteria bacterium]
MRGYFGIGVEGISKAFNVGNLFRTAHAFGASFVFSVDAHFKAREAAKADTSDAMRGHIPYYEWDRVVDMALPKGCALVAVELLDDAVSLPSFRHPNAAAYVLGRERGNVSDVMLDRADHVIRIPTRFCVNVGIAGAIVMYDRLVSQGRNAPRPLMPGGPHDHGPALHGSQVQSHLINERIRRDNASAEPGVIDPAPAE